MYLKFVDIYDQYDLWEQEEKISKLREANDQHVDDKKKMKRELAEERSKVSKLLSRTISNAEKRKVCEDLLKPYMGDTAVKCFIDGKDGEFAKVGKWTRYVYKVEEYSKKVFPLQVSRSLDPVLGFWTVNHVNRKDTC